jgi:hypothetical protein
MMTPRQEKADAIARGLRKNFGDDAVVINPLPLSSDQQMKIQIVDAKRDAVIRKLCNWGWIPAYLGVHYRVTTGGLVPASLFEVRIAEERQPIPDRRIHGEIADERKKNQAEVDAMRKHLGRK